MNNGHDCWVFTLLKEVSARKAIKKVETHVETISVAINTRPFQGCQLSQTSSNSTCRSEVDNTRCTTRSVIIVTPVSQWKILKYALCYEVWPIKWVVRISVYQYRDINFYPKVSEIRLDIQKLQPFCHCFPFGVALKIAGVLRIRILGFTHRVSAIMPLHIWWYFALRYSQLLAKIDIN